MSGQLINIKASDVDNKILTLEINGDDKSYFSLSADGVVSINFEPDFENPVDNNENNIYEFLFTVSDEEFEINKAISLEIDDVNLPATQFGSDITDFEFDYRSDNGTISLDDDGDAFISGSKPTVFKYFNGSWIQIMNGFYAPYACINGQISGDEKTIVCEEFSQNNGYKKYRTYFFVENDDPTSLGSWDYGERSPFSTEHVGIGPDNFELSGDGFGLARIYNSTGRSRLRNHYGHLNDNQGFWNPRYYSEVMPDSVGTDDPLPYYRRVTINRDASVMAFKTTNQIEGSHIKVYEFIDDDNEPRTGGTFTQIGQNIGRCNGNIRDVGNGWSETGQAMQLSGNGKFLLVNDPLYQSINDETQQYRGAICVFELKNASWTQVGSTIIGNSAGDRLGETQFQIDINDDGNRIVVSSKGEKVNGVQERGVVRIYDWSSFTNDWKQNGFDIIGDVELSNSWVISLSNDGKRIGIMDGELRQNINNKIKIFDIPKN